MREWLRNGWILELREPTDLFWIGGRGACPDELARETVLPAKIWNPDFFDLSAEEPLEAGWSVRISREMLLSLLNQPNENSAKPPRALVSWKSPKKDTFFAAVQNIQSEIRSGVLKKAVPVVCAGGYTAIIGFQDFLTERLVHALRTSQGTGLRVYGHWRESEMAFCGLLGLTPEDLFRVDGDQLKTMAVAGTAPLPVVSSEEVVAIIAHELLKDAKEREEHELVVDDLVKRLESMEGVEIGVEIGETKALRFRQLLHLVTPIQARLKGGSSEERIRSLTRHLHPTPALGLAPRSVDLSFLRKIDETLLPSARAGFGAPFVVLGESQTEAVVAIRQLRWKSEEALSDRLEVEILSGCGIVAASQSEKEWTELLAKRQAVTDGLGLSREVHKPLAFANRVIRDVVARGVRHFVVCAGARNAPLVVALDQWKKQSSVNLVVESFFDERAASFYALGVARSSGRPVAVVTTSGTAVTELHSAMAEADLSGVPLIALTADRPKRLRFSGAPQSLRQDSLFSYFAGGSVDLEEGDELRLPPSFVPPGGDTRPWHLNICFEEPLLADADSLSEKAEIWTSPAEKSSAFHVGKKSSFSEIDRVVFSNSLLRRSREAGAVIVGKLSQAERAPVREFLLKTKMPCLLEGASGLRGDLELRALELCSGDRVLQTKILAGEINQVFRFGGVPTTRVWRDLDDPKVRCLTTSVSLSRFSGLGRGCHIQVSDASALGELIASVELNGATTREADLAEASLLRADRDEQKKIDTLIAERPLSEPAWVRALSEEMRDADLVYVGNSLPIRWWDWVATRDLVHAVEANRGVNGIDGQISTALGLMRGSRDSESVKSGKISRREAWILIGDLTALYDLSGPWAMQFEELRKNWNLRLVVLNNSGGLIFRHVLRSSPSGSAPFENAHALGFQDWAKMWGMGYHRLTAKEQLLAIRDQLESFAVLEIVPNAAETAEFWKGLP